MHLPHFCHFLKPLALISKPWSSVLEVATLAFDVKHLLPIIHHLANIISHDSCDFIESAHGLASFIRATSSSLVSAMYFMYEHFVFATATQILLCIFTLRITTQLLAAIIELRLDLSQKLRAILVSIVKVSYCSENDRVFITEWMPWKTSLLRFHAHIICCHCWSLLFEQEHSVVLKVLQSWLHEVIGQSG